MQNSLQKSIIQQYYSGSAILIKVLRDSSVNFAPNIVNLSSCIIHCLNLCNINNTQQIIFYSQEINIISFSFVVSSHILLFMYSVMPISYACYVQVICATFKNIFKQPLRSFTDIVSNIISFNQNSNRLLCYFRLTSRSFTLPVKLTVRTPMCICAHRHTKITKSFSQSRIQTKMSPH